LLRKQGLCAGTTPRAPRATLRIVLILNVALFAIELIAGLIAGSAALLADSLDSLGDALVYGFSLYVVGRAVLWKVRAALAKAAVMGLFGAFVLASLYISSCSLKSRRMKPWARWGARAARQRDMLRGALAPSRRGHQYAFRLALFPKRRRRERVCFVGIVRR
jgi:hypothetical protein